MDKLDNTKLDQIRNIPLEAVFESFGSIRDPKDPANNWRTPAGRISTNNDLFFNHDTDKGGAGAISLAMHIGGYGFTKALAHLGATVGVDATVAQYRIEAPIHAKRVLENTKAPKPKTEIPLPNLDKLNQVRKYLTEIRALPSELVEKTIKSGRLWADNFGNAVFALRDPGLTKKTVGAELRGTYEKPFHGVRGEDKGLFITGNSNGKVAAFVESSIDALSYEALHPNELVLGSTGSGHAAVAKAAGLLKAQGFKIISGFDQDKDGDRAHSKLNEAVGVDERRRPGDVKDWNKLLQDMRDAERTAEVKPDVKVKTTPPVRKENTIEDIDR